MFSFNSRIRFSEADKNGEVTLPGIINYFQDCSTFHSEDIGLGIDYLKEQKAVWILSSWQIIIERYPRIGEEVQISTWATGFDGICGTRNFCMTDHSGRAAYANSIWVFMDLEKGRPAKPKKEDMELYGVEQPLEMEYASRKIKLPKQLLAADPFPVRKYHIDTNEHVNNCQYVRMALEMQQEESKIWQMRAEYKKPAVYGDYILPKAAREEERTVVELCDMEDHPYAVVELIGEKVWDSNRD